MVGRAEHVLHMAKLRHTYSKKFLVVNSQPKRPLGRPRQRRDGNIKMHLKEEGCVAVNIIQLDKYRAQRRALLNTENNFGIS